MPYPADSTQIPDNGAESTPDTTNQPDSVGSDDALQSDKPNLNDSFIHVDLTDENNNLNESQIMQEIEVEMKQIDEEYEEFGYYHKVLASEDEYNQKKHYTDFPIPDGSNRNVPFLLMFSDIFTGRAKRQTDTASPLFLMELAENYKGQGAAKFDIQVIRDREMFLDYKMRRDVKLSELHQNSYARAYYQGSAIIKVPFEHREEYFSEKCHYEPGDIAKFEKKHAEKLKDPQYQQYWLDLHAGKPVDLIDETTTVTKHGNEPYRVDLTRFFARLSIVNLNDQKLISENLQLNWIQVSRNFDTGYYNAIDKEEFQALYPNYEKQYFEDLYEGIIQTDIEEEGKIRKYQIVYDSKNRRILRLIRYPYKHNHVYYVNMRARPRDDMWLGFMAWERLEDTISAAKAFQNSFINGFALAHTPTIITDSGQELGRQTVTTGNINVIRLSEKGSSFNQVKYDIPPTDEVATMGYFQQFASLLEGIDAAIASGQETPGDSRAPAAKAQLKAAMSTMRIEDLIINVQTTGDAELALQCDSNYYQFNSTADLGYFKSNDEYSPLKAEAQDYQVLYITHGSKLAFNKESDQQTAIQTVDFLQKAFPAVWQDVDVQKTMLEIILNNTQGSVNQNKQRILAPMDSIIAAKKQSIIDQQKKDEQVRAMGLDPNEARTNPQAFMQKVNAMKAQMDGQQGNVPPQIAPTTPAPSVQLPPRPQVPQGATVAGQTGVA